MISIDKQSRTPVYEQLVDSFEKEIILGIRQPDSIIPSVRALSVELGINPNTVAKAYGALERDGVIYSVAGVGCFVAKQKDRADRRFLEEFEQKTREAKKAGVSEEMLRGILSRVYDEKEKHGQPGGDGK